MSELEKFTRYRDFPTLTEAGTSPVVTSLEQLEGMTLEERQRVVVSVEVLSQYSDKLNEDVKRALSALDGADLKKMKDSLSKDLQDKLNQKLKDLGKQELSLDILNLWFGIQSSDPEIRWERPNWNKPYTVEIYKSTKATFEDPILLASVPSPKDYYFLGAVSEGEFIAVRAKDNDTGVYGKFSPIVEIESEDIRMAKFLEYIQGKLTSTAINEGLLKALKENISKATDEYVTKETSKIQKELDEAKKILTETISRVQQASETEWSQLRDAINRNGTDIVSMNKRADGLAESINTITAKADNALTGIQRIDTVIAEKDASTRRQIENAVSLVEGTRTELRKELAQTATKLESKITAESDERTLIGNTLARTTEKVNQISTETEALKSRAQSIETSVAGNKTRTDRLEENLTNLDKSTVSKIESLKSSFNSDHFYNYNMISGTDGWMTDNPGQVLHPQINTSVTPNDRPYPNYITCSTNLEMVLVKSNQVKPIERNRTYSLTVALRVRETSANLDIVRLYLLPFDRAGNKAKQRDGLYNFQGGSIYPLITSKIDVQPDNWTVLSGEIHQWASSYPIPDASEAGRIPPSAVFACPAVEAIAKSGAGPFDIDIAILDLRDVTSEKSVEASIESLNKAVTEKNKALVETLDTQNSQFRKGIESKLTEVTKSVADAQATSNSKISDLTTKYNQNTAKLQTLEQTVNNEKSANALKLETLRASFEKSKVNQIKFDLNTTPTFDVQPPLKFRIIDKNAATLISPAYVKRYPEEKYLKFWGRTLIFSGVNRLSCKAGERLYVSLDVWSKTTVLNAYLRFIDGSENQVGALLPIGDSGTLGTPYTLMNNTIRVPDDTTIQTCELFLDTGNSLLSEDNDPILITNPQLRPYDEIAIRSDTQINELRRAVSNQDQAHIKSVDEIKAELNGRLSTQSITQTARAQADEVATATVNVAKSQLETKINTKVQEVQTTLATELRTQTEKVTQQAAEFNDYKAKTNSAITALTEADRSLASRHEELKSSVARDFTQAKAEAKSYTDTTVNKTVSGVESRLSAKVGKVETSIEDVKKTVVTNTKSLTDSVTKQTNEFNQYKAQTNSSIATLTRDNQALATKHTALTAQVGRDISAAKQEVKSYSDSTLNQAVSGVESRLSAKVGKVETSIEEVRRVAADNKENINATIGLRINSNNKIVGWSASTSGPYNEFNITANNFKIHSSGSDFSPFIVRSGQLFLNGKVTIGSDGSNILRDTIFRRHPGTPESPWKTNFDEIGIISREVAGDNAPRPDQYTDLIENNVSFVMKAENATANVRSKVFQEYIKVESGVEYILSYWRQAHVLPLYVDLEFATGSSMATNNASTYRANNVDGQVVLFSDLEKSYPSRGVTDDSNRCVCRFRVPDNANYLTVIWFCVGAGTRHLRLWKPQLEKATRLNQNRATPWKDDGYTSTTLIDGASIATGTLKAKSVVVSEGANLLFNAGFKNSGFSFINNRTEEKAGEYGPTRRKVLGWDWSPVNTVKRDGAVLFALNRDTRWYGTNDPNFETAYIKANGPNWGEGVVGYFSQMVKTEPGKYYMFSLYVSAHRCAATVVFDAHTSPTNSLRIPNDIFVCSDERNNPAGGPQLHGTNSTPRKFYTFVAKSNYTKIAICMHHVTQNGYFFFNRPMLEELAPGQKNPSEWVPGPMSMIDLNGNATFGNLSAISSNLGFINAGKIHIGNLHEMNSDGSIKRQWVGRGTFIDGDGTLHTNRLLIRSNPTSQTGVDPVNINGNFIVRADGSIKATNGEFTGTITATGGTIPGVLVVGGDPNNGVVIDGPGKKIRVVENGYNKVVMGYLY